MGQPPVGELDRHQMDPTCHRHGCTRSGAQPSGSLPVGALGQRGTKRVSTCGKCQPCPDLNSLQSLPDRIERHTEEAAKPLPEAPKFRALCQRPSSRPLLVLTELIGSPLSLGATWLWSQSLPRYVTTRLQDCTGATVPLKHLPLDDTNSCCHLEKHFVDLAFGPLVP